MEADADAAIDVEVANLDVRGKERERGRPKTTGEERKAEVVGVLARRDMIGSKGAKRRCWCIPRDGVTALAFVS